MKFDLAIITFLNLASKLVKSSKYVYNVFINC